MRRALRIAPYGLAVICYLARPAPFFCELHIDQVNKNPAHIAVFAALMTSSMLPIEALIDFLRNTFEVPDLEVKSPRLSIRCSR